MRFFGTIVLVLLWITAFGQSRQITGRIVDEESQKGVAGATVTISNTERKAFTNQMGYFLLQVEPADKSLVIASLGYVTSKIDLPAVEAFKAAVKREYLPLEPLDVGLFSVEVLDPPDSLEARSTDQSEMDAEYPGGWQHLYVALAQALKTEANDRLLKTKEQRVRFTVMANGAVSVAGISGASDSLKAIIEAAFKSLKAWKPARQNKLAVAQHFELPLVWSDEIYTVVEQGATPVEGIQAFYKAISRSIRYPAQARRLGIEGKVFVEFLIQKDGSITDARVTRGIGGGCDEEALRVITMGPKWLPARLQGEPVVQRYTLPIFFALDGRTPGSESISKPEATTYAQWLTQKMTYPAEARRLGIQGLVVLSFRIGTDGGIESVNIMQDIGATCGSVAQRVVAMVPKYLTAPLAKNRQPVYQPIQFHLGSEKEPRPRLPDLSKWTQLDGMVLPPISITAIGIERSVRYLGTSRPPSVSLGPTNPRRSYDSFAEALERPRIEELSLVGKSITTIPPDITKFRSLRFLDLENNLIQTLPPEIGMLNKLVKFFMPLNQLKELPVEIANLKALRVLGLASNRFEEFPREVLALTKLTGLDLSGNKISNLPPAIGQMRDLQTLFLHDNNISTFPEEFYKLTQLKALSLGGNPISEKEKERIEKTFKKTYIRFD
jgi:TonB family protein